MRLFRAFQLFNAHVIYLHDWPRRLPRKQTTESARREQEIWKAQIFLTLCKRTVTVNSRTLIALSRRETFPPLEQTIDVQFGLDWLVGGSANVCLLQEGSIGVGVFKWKDWNGKLGQRISDPSSSTYIWQIFAFMGSYSRQHKRRKS